MKDTKESPNGVNDGSKNSSSSIAPGNIITGPTTFSPSPLKIGIDSTDSDVGFPNSIAATQDNIKKKK